MSLKENVDYIKEEISTQESFIENFFKLEKFYKKYKIAIISTVAIVLVSFGGIQISSYLEEQNKIAANEAFNICLEEPNNKTALETLKSKDENLYDIVMYINNKKENNLEYFKELSSYSKAIENNDIAKIEKAIQSQKFLLKDFAIFNKALILAQNSKYKEAKETLALIPITSDVASLVKMLNHYMLTK
ncbi:MAG: hypothetical protein U9Q20_06840 [Campylobacterota bacterium]|nr:hypothetical protein [Campylobacterota bacterium]